MMFSNRSESPEVMKRFTPSIDQVPSPLSRVASSLPLETTVSGLSTVMIISAVDRSLGSS